MRLNSGPDCGIEVLGPNALGQSSTFEHVLKYDDQLAVKEHLPPSSYSIEHPPPYFIRLFEHAAQHQLIESLMLCGEGIGRFEKLLKEYITEEVSAKVGELAQANQPFAVPLDMHAHFVSGATLSPLAWWLEYDMPFSSHQKAQYLLSPHGALSSSA